MFDARDGALIGIVSWTARTDGEPVCGFVSGVVPLARYRYWIMETAAKTGIAAGAMIRIAAALRLHPPPDSLPAAAMVGGAQPATDDAGRAVVMLDRLARQLLHRRRDRARPGAHRRALRAARRRLQAGRVRRRQPSRS